MAKHQPTCPAVVITSGNNGIGFQMARANGRDVQDHVRQGQETGALVMITQKEKAKLVEAQETLLIPLYSKAVMGKRPNSFYSDRKAEEILDHVEYDFSRLKIPEKTVVMMCIRAKKLDAYARDF